MGQPPPQPSRQIPVKVTALAVLALVAAAVLLFWLMSGSLPGDNAASPSAGPALPVPKPPPPPALSPTDPARDDGLCQVQQTHFVSGHIYARMTSGPRIAAAGWPYGRSYMADSPDELLAAAAPRLLSDTQLAAAIKLTDDQRRKLADVRPPDPQPLLPTGEEALRLQKLIWAFGQAEDDAARKAAHDQIAAAVSAMDKAGRERFAPSVESAGRQMQAILSPDQLAMLGKLLDERYHAATRAAHPPVPEAPSVPDGVYTCPENYFNAGNLYLLAREQFGAPPAFTFGFRADANPQAPHLARAVQILPARDGPAGISQQQIQRLRDLQPLRSPNVADPDRLAIQQLYAAWSSAADAPAKAAAAAKVVEALKALAPKVAQDTDAESARYLTEVRAILSFEQIEAVLAEARSRNVIPASRPAAPN